MNRRSFFSSVRKKGSTDTKHGAGIGVVNSGLQPNKGKLSREQAVHLLKRTMFGSGKDDVNFLANKKTKKAVALLTGSEQPLPEPPLNNYNDPDTKKTDANYFVDDEVPAGQTWVHAKTVNGKNNGRRKNSFKSWWIGQMLNQERSIREKMVLFWHNHFATETTTVGNAFYVYNHNDLLRRHALGNFKEMVKAISTDPAMLRYLNGYASTKKAPDENYGRELQELFTIGKGPGSGYTEGDVKAAARVLTGYKIDNENFTSLFDPARHDDGDKQFSSFYDNRIIKGRKGAEGAAELDELLDMICMKEEVSKFICRKIYRFFVYHTIDEITEKNIILPLATIFRKKNYEIMPVLESLLNSQHFFDAANYGSMIKSPVDFTVGLCREFNVSFPDASLLEDQYGLWEQLRNQSAAMQQNIGDPPNVAGWQAYYQHPQYDKLWISSDTLPKRNRFTDRMVGAGLVRNTYKVAIDLVAFTKQLPDPANPVALVNDAIRLLYGLDVSAADKEFIKTSILLSGLTNMNVDHYWTDSWNAFLKNPADKKNSAIVINKLKALYKYLMNRPEYQLC